MHCTPSTCLKVKVLCMTCGPPFFHPGIWYFVSWGLTHSIFIALNCNQCLTWVTDFMPWNLSGKMNSTRLQLTSNRLSWFLCTEELYDYCSTYLEIFWNLDLYIIFHLHVHIFKILRRQFPPAAHLRLLSLLLWQCLPWSLP